MNNTYLKERVATADELQWLKEQYDTSVKKISNQSTYYAIGYLVFSFLPVGLVTERVRHVKEHGFDTIIDALGIKGWPGMTAGVALIGAYLILSDWYIAGRKKPLKEEIMVLIDREFQISKSENRVEVLRYIKVITGEYDKTDRLKSLQG